jgi:PAS domain S-box-containing protein
MSADITLSCFPSKDRSFARFVERRRRELARGAAASAAELQAGIRRWYPRAVVREQSKLGALGPPVWYVYRDGSPNLEGHLHWWEQPGAGRIEFDGRGLIVAADDRAAEIVGVRPGDLTGRSWRDVIPADAQADEWDWVWQTLNESGRVMSVFDCRLPDGRRRIVEYRSQKTDDPNRFIGYWREVETLEAAPG